MKVLVLVDLQNDFIDGALGTPEAKAIIPNVIKKLNNVDRQNTIILMTKDTHHDDYLNTYEGQKLPIKHCIENTPGWSICKEITELIDRGHGFCKYSSNDIKGSRIYKNTFGSDVLRDFLIRVNPIIEEVEFCGLCTDICVISNVLCARQALPNTKIVVDASCCAGTTVEKHEAALSVMESCQVDIVR